MGAERPAAGGLERNCRPWAVVPLLTAILKDLGVARDPATAPEARGSVPYRYPQLQAQAAAVGKSEGPSAAIVLPTRLVLRESTVPSPQSREGLLRRDRI